MTADNLSFENSPLPYLEALARRHPNVAHFTIGDQACALIIHGHLASQVLGPLADALPRRSTYVGGLIGQSSFNSGGAIHRELRDRVAPTLSGKTVARATTITAEEVRLSMAMLKQGTTLDVVPFLGQLMDGIMSRILFGARTPGARLVSALAMTESGAAPEIALGLRRQVDEELRSLLLEENASGEARSVMGALSRTGLADSLVFNEVVAHFLSGYDALANTMAWAWILLSQAKSEGRELRPSCDEKLARRIFNETLRLYPPGWLFSRRARRDCILESTKIEEGTLVFLSPYLSHRDARFFPTPERFDPERWESRPDARRTAPFFFPFGSGVHRCTGEALSYALGTRLLRDFDSRWRFHLVKQGPVPIWARGNTALRPGEPIFMEVAEAM